MIGKTLRPLLLLAALSVSSIEARAASPTQKQEEIATFDRASHLAQLDSLLAAGDYNSINAYLQHYKSNDEFISTLDWLGEKFKQGNSVYVAYSYSLMLSGVAQRLPPDQADGLKGTALAAILYAVTVAAIEGLQCADISARYNRSEQFVGLLMNSDLLKLDEGKRQQAALLALMIERITWDRRKNLNDARFLCANGLAAMSAGLAHGMWKEMKPAEGQLGRTITVAPPADFKFERLANEIWWAKAEDQRAKFPEALKIYARIKAIPDVGLARQ